ncbi:DUF2252 domain-containing protein [Ktedonobacter robiniae]|uniref:DUF2252 domain-containing protein n=1 Tax=Ktedonobacter robiniae TaxID=2778365 RepID=A0ABQ3UUV4_9CHLR|nr:DUF2252 domain-containing protein [Ktedonobacter robiniae]GHO56172.1 hypothetical protein KSB_46470 [Ktedonobacter robiniae]
MSNVLRSSSTLYARTSAERYAAGKALRAHCPRSSHARWEPAPNRPDPLSILEASNRTRVKQLVPIRYGRMLVSPYNFLRGSAAMMAHDLASTPTTGILTQICGDAHLGNFGIYATPERNLVFDVSDFDETVSGPWEWDVKRLTTSIVVVGRQNGFSARDCKQAVMSCVASYHKRMYAFSTMRRIDLWYARVDVELLRTVADRDLLPRLDRAISRAQQRTSIRAFPKLTHVVNGQVRIKDDPPLIGHHPNARLSTHLSAFVAGYLESTREEQKTLLQWYQPIDLAWKVVGVASVGTRCYIVLLLGEGEENDPLFLQIKEARPSALEPYTGPSPYSNPAQRIVHGQRLMQAASDIFLGWTQFEDVNYYVRQLRDMRWSSDMTTMSLARFTVYAQLCGWALARAHARAGDPALISGYLGKSDSFAQALAEFACAYADQNERDYARLVAAVEAKHITATTDI